MADKVRLLDPFGILQELNPAAANIADANPDIEGVLAKIDDRIEKAAYLEPYFFHPDPAIQARAASAGVSVDVGSLGDYMINVLAAAKDSATASAAAKAAWDRDKAGTGSIAYVVDSLRAYQHSLGRTNTRRIINILLQHAPDGESRARFTDAASSNGENLLQS